MYTLFYNISFWYIIGFALVVKLLATIKYYTSPACVLHEGRSIIKNLALKNVFKALIDLSIVIGFIFGIHADILAGYDKNKNNSIQNYDWLNTRDVMRFPIDQLKLKDSAASLKVSTEVKYADIGKPTKAIHYYILNDKTGSIENSKEFADYSKVLRQGFSDYINEGRSQDSSLDTKSLLLNDLITLCMIKRLYDVKKNNSELKIFLSSNCYIGGDSVKSIGSSARFDEVKDISNTELITKINLLNKILATYKAKNYEGTDFSVLLHEINTNLSQGQGEINAVVIFISDFIHEKDLPTLEYSMKSFCNTNLSKIHQINLLEYPFKKKSNEVDNKNEAISKSVKDYFTTYMNNIYHYPIKADKYMKDRNGYNSILNCINYTQDLDGHLDKAHYAYFYKPSLSNTTLNAVSCNLELKDSGEYNLTLRSNVAAQNQIPYLKVGGKDGMLYLNEPAPLTFTRECSVRKVEAYNLSNEANYFLEISRSSPKDIQQIRLPFIFRELLPETSSKILLFCYILWFLALTSASILYLTLVIKKIFTWTNGNKVFYFGFLLSKLYFLAYTVSILCNATTMGFFVFACMFYVWFFLVFFKYLRQINI